MTQLDGARLRRALAIRGLSGRDLCRLARISKPTLASLRAGRHVSARTLRRVDIALAAVQPLPEVTLLLRDDDEQPGGGAS